MATTAITTITSTATTVLVITIAIHYDRYDYAVLLKSLHPLLGHKSHGLWYLRCRVNGAIDPIVQLAALLMRLLLAQPMQAYSTEP